MIFLILFFFINISAMDNPDAFGQLPPEFKNKVLRLEDTNKFLLVSLAVGAIYEIVQYFRRKKIDEKSNECLKSCKSMIEILEKKVKDLEENTTTNLIKEKNTEINQILGQCIEKHVKLQELINLFDEEPMQKKIVIMKNNINEINELIDPINSQIKKNFESIYILIQQSNELKKDIENIKISAMEEINTSKHIALFQIIEKRNECSEAMIKSFNNLLQNYIQIIDKKFKNDEQIQNDVSNLKKDFEKLKQQLNNNKNNKS